MTLGSLMGLPEVQKRSLPIFKNNLGAGFLGAEMG